jgi:hypothetical protein
MVEKLFTSKLNRISLHTLSHLLFNMVIGECISNFPHKIFIISGPLILTKIGNAGHFKTNLQPSKKESHN